MKITCSFLLFFLTQIKQTYTNNVFLFSKEQKLLLLLEVVVN